MIINRLLINVFTPDGEYGVDIPFNTGLNIIHAENTEGKSTCMQAIVYALGLEGSIGPSRNVPLKKVLTKELDDADGNPISVIESKIYVELDNGIKKITVSRSSSTDKKDLISVWDDHIFTSNSDAKMTDYYVRLEGAAQRERGFHTFLANYLGFTLPNVMRFDGNKSPLYLETLFSLFYVEQRNGWGGIQNILPTYLSIREVGTKALEYVLGLECFENDEKKYDINQEIKIITERWENTRIRMDAVAAKVDGILSGVPESPVENFRMTQVAAITVSSAEDEEIVLDDAINFDKQSLSELKSRQIPEIRQVNKELESKLAERMEYLSELERNVKYLLDDFDTSTAYVKSIINRMDQVADDLRQYKDVRRLINIGSEEKFHFSKNVCPTCGQSVDDSLLQHTHNHELLTIEENIAYLANQKSSLDNLLKIEEERLRKKSSAIDFSRQKLSETRASIRTLKESLISDGRIPSKEALKEELNLEARIERYQSAQLESKELVNKFSSLSDDYGSAKAKLVQLPKDRLSNSDRIKINLLKKYFTKNLELFEYKSTRIDEFSISENSFKPVINDVELSSEASASDNVRIIWAYLYALLQLSRDSSLKLNHINMLILDEPRQQSAREANFSKFINLISETVDTGQQVIVATSEKLSDLNKIISTAEHKISLIHFDGNLIKKIELKDNG